MNDNRLKRVDSARLEILNQHGIPATLFARDDVPVESSAITELLSLFELQETVARVAESDRRFAGLSPGIARVAVTPDFHKGAGIPIGTVLETRGFAVPAAIGNDINCGMRLHVTTLREERVRGSLDALERELRHAYFEGGRDIAMTRTQREALLRNGLRGLCDTVPRSQKKGLWAAFHEFAEDDLPRVEREGSLPADSVTAGLRDFLGPESASRDSQIGSIGGGNHFVELQRVEKILDASTAHAWGLKAGAITIMAHSGSVSVGHVCGGAAKQIAARGYPGDARHPENGVFPVTDPDNTPGFWDALHNAANFAFANRMFLALIMLGAIRKAVGDASMRLLYDAPHNMVWRERKEGVETFVHRKGACPARGLDGMAGTPFAFYGEPVLVPGSMGASSFILAGCGNPESLSSASHGAGRKLSRGDALKVDDATFRRFMRDLRVVTPVDFKRQDIAMRHDIIAKKLEDIKKEAPFAYKGIGPVIQTLEDAGIARPVAELRPILTVKG